MDIFIFILYNFILNVYEYLKFDFISWFKFFVWTSMYLPPTCSQKHHPASQSPPRCNAANIKTINRFIYSSVSSVTCSLLYVIVIIWRRLIIRINILLAVPFNFYYSSYIVVLFQVIKLNRWIFSIQFS